MENRNSPRQQNHLSDANAATDLDASLSESSAPWNGGLPIPYEARDGSHIRSGNPAGRPLQRPPNMPSEQSTYVEERPIYITVRRRQIPLENAARFNHLTEDQIESQLRMYRENVVREFVDLTDPSLQTLLERCSLVLNMDVNIERKYIELDIWRVFEANKEKPRFLHLTQGLGILEKYASNLIKENRPPYWRNVKFTSSLVQLHVGRLIGSRDILSQMGYTQDIHDGVAFPSNVPEPDVARVKDLATDLFFARYEIDTLLVNKHPFYEMDPPVPQEEVELPRLFQATFERSLPQRFPPRVSRPSLPTSVSTESGVSRPSQPPPTSARNQYPPTPSPRRPGGRSPIPPQEKHKEQASVEEQVSERYVESEGDSEYEDAEDGIDQAQAQASGNSHTQVSSNFDCRICGESNATKFCKECKDTFCAPCDSLYHKHASRQRHFRSQLQTETATPSDQPISSGAAAAPSSPVPQNQRTAVSNIAASASDAARPTPRPRPVPAPRRNIKQPPKTPEPSEKARRPPKPESSTPQVQQNTVIQQPPSFEAGTQQLAAQAVIRRSNQIQDQTRPILRPPPMPPSFNATPPSSQRGNDEKDSNYTVDEAPPPLPPPKLKTAKPKMPVESRTPISTPPSPTSPEEDGALSCPYCFCLNSAGNKTCLFCKKPLPAKSDSRPQNQSALPQSQEMVDVRNFPSPGLAAQDPARSAEISFADEDPDQEWPCEFCTYINKNRRICAMCFKSRTTPLPPKKKMPVRNQSKMEKAYPPRVVTNLAAHISSQQIPASTVPTKKPDLENSQAAPTGSAANPQAQQTGAPMRPPVGPPIGPLLGNTMPPVGQPWEAANTTAPVVPGGPPLGSSASPGVAGPAQVGILNQTGMVYPGVNPPFSRDPGMPRDPHGFVPPPPFVDPLGATGLAPEINPSAAGNSPVSLVTGYLSTPPVTAWNPPPVDETFRRHQEEIYISGARYVEWLKAGETEGFTAEEVNIASILGIEDRHGPIHWLQTTWYDLIHRVMVELSVPENSQEIGNVSPEEAKNALIECTGEVSRAVNKCMENRKKKVRELQQAGVYAKTDCISALDTTEGDTEKAILELEKMALQPMLQRILNSCLPDTATHDDVFRALARQVDNDSPQDRANFKAIVTDRGQDRDRRIRAILAEKDVSSWGKADIVIKLIDEGFEVDDSLTAAGSCRDYRCCVRFLRQECPLCIDQLPRTQMITFLHCQHSVCRDCVTQFITITIRDKNIMHLVCPVCGKPENLEDEAVAAEYFNNFDIMIRGLVDQGTHDLFQQKLRDRTLMKEPNFRWCSHCSSGFINERPEILKMPCPNCHQFTCFQCNRKWEDQHEGITCEQFRAWMEQNDPDFQAAGLAAHLKRNGIVCPNCKFRYDLSKGGCMHFKCAMCSHEFCSGCYNSFIHAERQNCPVSNQCTVRGLHAHHPRDCYFYLRDLQPGELQRLLHDNNVAYNTEPPEGQGNADEQAGAAAPLVCKVNEQKETVDGLRDEECGEQVQAGYAGLCKKHYVEYLVVLVNDNLLDPADIMSSEDLGHVLRRGFKETPQKQPRMRDNQYQQLLLQTVKNEIALPPKPPRKRILDDEQEVPVVQNVEEEEEDEREEDEIFPSDDDDDHDDDRW